MSPTRLVTRWTLTLLALLLGLVALLLLAVRLAFGLADGLAPRLESLLSARFGALVTIADLDTRLARFDPQLVLDGLTIDSREGVDALPLLEVESGYLRLDTRQSLRSAIPVVGDARLSGVTVHLYQDENLNWRWPDPARLPPEFTPAGELDLERLDFWVGVLLRQRAFVDDMRLVLHGRDREVVLEAPRLLMTGDQRRAHLEGEVWLAGQSQAAMQVALEVLPGDGGLRDFNAALKADMHLDSLVTLVEVLSRNEPIRLDEASGDVRLWGRWQQGELADARLDLDVSALALSHDNARGERRRLELEDLEARGQWLRAENGWEAWLEGDARTPAGQAPDELDWRSGPPLPRRWHASGDGSGWWLNTSGFDLGSLAAWRSRVPLPEALDRVVATLDPQGRVEGFGLGLDEGQWLARVALHDVKASPWQQAPGGGPFDMWVEARDFTGRVRFQGSQGSQLNFPNVFAEPMTLTRASGEVTWSYDGPRTVVSGRELSAEWQGADVAGQFGLSAGKGQRGGFGLSLDFSGVDAIDTPLVDWLPVGIMGDELLAWLGNGAQGRVPQGSLRLHVPLAGGAERIQTSFGLDLAFEQGRLPFAEGWPALEAVQGRLALEDSNLEVLVDHAESQGVEARQGRVTLVDDRLEVESQLSATSDALRSYLLAIPVPGVEALEAWRGEGRVEGELALSLPLDEPEALEVDLDTEVDVARITHLPSEFSLTNLQGALSWQQRDRQGGLRGELSGRALGGPIRADIDTLGGTVDMSGRLEASQVADLSGAGAVESLLTGGFAWQGSLAMDAQGTRLSLHSDLEGLAIALPSPLGKQAATPRELHVDVDLGEGRVDGRLGDELSVRWRDRDGSDIGQGQVWLGRPAGNAWHGGDGWVVNAYQPRLDIGAWGAALRELSESGASPAPGDGLAGVLRDVRLETNCLVSDGRCLGSLAVEGGPQAGGGWRLALDGSLLQGQLDYRPTLDEPLDIALSRLSFDALVPDQAVENSRSLFDELATPPEPEPLPGWVNQLPGGRLRIADIERAGQRFGPLTASWRSTPERLTIAPLGLTLGEISARGELVWEATGAQGSLTRARLDLDGRDLGTAMERLGQTAAIRSGETRVKSQLAWPGAPWQFALERSRGSIEATLRDGRFVNIASPSARVIGLLNVDNLLRRLRLDFSDVTGQGTAFDSVTGAATLYGGILETRGPIEVEGPATFFTLEGQVDLARRELDQRLGVTVPISRNLPLAAVIAGAPVVGGALFIADKLFGDAIDSVTRIHYRVRGPWTSPDISVESAE
ncbi:YhdP family protein [Halomonas urumqiensis]|uniref:TIGR02099 family protein n=1 Tax=Halomonas urumqiensis TaxID=1684789 RepID=A0A2N7UG62_9GAMM|nr:YhdP family protein [Halomonas urumqiensis]PMR79458.1 TIGR02099 family protein [Halomonas urumqiensis]PTB01419.1 TIGR02099 family protein [Halomonas urumqiensis]GHE22491.1 TIGR02099 family protein [Halomonas urumqiensis]